MSKEQMKFEDLALPDALKTALNRMGFETATKVQEKCIPLAIDGTDIIASAETGSGKTAAYAIPMLARILEDRQRQALIMAPTRELVYQIAEVVRDLTNDCENFHVTSLVGGADMRKQLKSLKRNPQVVVATPGRLLDHLKRGSLKLNSCEILVLDEGDRMLDMGFAPQLDEILKYLPMKRQTSLFTATLPPKLKELAEKYLFQPSRVDCGRDSLPVEKIKQTAVKVGFHDKDGLVLDEINTRTGSIIIFTRTKVRANLLSKYLREYGNQVRVIHGDRTQGQRNQAIADFKKGKSRLLVATDLAARGLDVPQVEHVINFDLPMMDEDYVHRIGRTARNGAEGEALSFVMPEEVRHWMSLVRKYKIKGADLQSDKNSEGKTAWRKKSGGKPSGKKAAGGNSSQGKPSGNKPSSKRFSKKKTASANDGDKPTNKMRKKSSKKVGKKAGKKSSFKSAGPARNKRGKKTQSRSRRAW